MATDAQKDIHALRATLAAAPAAGERTVAVPRRPGHPARVATLAVRCAPVTLMPPPVSGRRHLPPVPLWAVRALEEDPPAGVKPLDGLLLTTVPVTNCADAQERVAWDVCRWTIEVWHKVLKPGCARQRCQLASAENLRRALARYSVIAWRVLYATLLARAGPDLPCAVLLEAAEWQELYCAICAIHTTPSPPAQPPSLGEAVQWLARLGGYMGRRRDGPPGPIVFWRGLQRLGDVMIMYQVFAPPPGRRKCGYGNVGKDQRTAESGHDARERQRVMGDHPRPGPGGESAARRRPHARRQAGAGHRAARARPGRVGVAGRRDTMSGARRRVVGAGSAWHGLCRGPTTGRTNAAGGARDAQGGPSWINNLSRRSCRTRSTT